MAYNGDFNPGDTINLKFTTVLGTGAPASLSSGAVSVYKDGSTTQSTAGVTLTADFDSVVGLNNVLITLATDGTYYSGGSNFQVIITTGTVGGVSVVGYVACEFSLNARSALRPTTAGATIDVQPDGSVIASGGLTDASIATAVWLNATRSLTDKLNFELSSAGIIAMWAAAVRELSASGNTAVAAAVSAALASAFSAIAPALMADAVWDEAMAGHVAAGSTGLGLATADNEAIVIATAAGLPGDVWDEAMAGHLTAGTTGAKLNASGAAGDPLASAVPGAYGAGTAGKVLGDLAGGGSPATIAAAVWAKVIDTQGSITAQQAMDVILAVVAGVTADAGLTFKSPNGGATRLVATVNALNERLTITLTPSA